MTSVLSANGQVKTDSVLPKVDSLKAVIVRPKEVRPHLKGDTLEYNTANIHVRPNAAVEELLGRLPGLQIDANGTITYNGTKIEKLLVDGEDLFGSDPTLITRSFDASRIDKVQLLDRKSDHARFTGIDDGNRTKTINLILKESSKKGYFGKIEAGDNAEGNYSAAGLLASFRDREQLTALGMASNIGSLGFSSNTGNGAISLSVLGPANDPLGAVAGGGVPKISASGLHYANTWNGLEDHITGNYQFGHLYTRPLTTTTIIQALPDSVYTQDQQSNSVNSQDQHFANIVYDWLPDSLSALKFTFLGNQVKGNNQLNATGSSAFNGVLVNNSRRTIKSSVDQGNWSGNMMWRSRIGQDNRRILSAVIGLSKIDNTADGYLQSRNNFYQPDGSLQSLDTTDQRKSFNIRTTSGYGSLNYTEPLWKTAVLAFSYSLSLTDNKTEQATYNKEGGKYTSYVDSLSDDVHQETANQRLTINLQGLGKTFTYTLGGDIIDYHYHQDDLLADSSLHQHYLNLAPRIMINYHKDPATQFTLFYNANTQLPSPGQLQTARNNNDPLHITLGNPDLRPGFNQGARLRFQRIKPWLIAVEFGLGFTSNSISNRTLTDSLGRQITQPVNVNGGHNASLNFSISKRLLGIDTRLFGNFSYTRNVSFINADLSRNDSYNPGGGIEVGKHVPDKYDLRFNTQFVYFDNRSSLNTTAGTRYWEQHHNGVLTVYLLQNYILNSNLVYIWQQAANASSKNNSMLLWNASFGRDFLNNRLVARLQVNNLLDQNAGLSRTNIGNVNTQILSNLLGRYWMLSLSYRFDHKFRNK